MWVVEGPFDGEVVNETNFKKTKLLKPGTKYTLGRKDRALTIAHKKISHNHLVFTVGPYTEQDAANPDFVPSLTVHNLGTKARTLEQGPSSTTVNAGAVQDVGDRDILHVISGVTITVKWEKVCCYIPLVNGKPLIPFRDCAKLGISAVTEPHPGVTHHLTTNYTLTPPVAASLLSAAQLVTPAWLEELLISGTSTNGPSSLENKYILPSVTRFRPTHSPSLPSSLKNTAAWEPDEARVDMFKGKRVVFVGERGREVSSDVRELTRRGGAQYECCAVEGGQQALHSVLAKGRAKGKELVLVADEPAMKAALGRAGWKEFMDEAAGYDLRYIAPERLIQAAVHIDLSYIDCAISSVEDAADRPVSPLPDMILNTYPDEPSVPPSASPREDESIPAPARKKLARRLTTRTPSRAPSPSPFSEVSTPAEKAAEPAADKDQEGVEGDEFKEFEVQPRKKLRKRLPPKSTTVDGGLATGDVANTMLTLQEPDLAAKTSDSVPPTPSRRPNLKRRLGSARAVSSEPSFPIFYEPTASATEEGPHKKHKALFETLDPDRIAQSEMADYMQIGREGQSLTQAETQSGASVTQGGMGSTNAGLEVVPEEQEESATMSQVTLEGSGDSQQRSQRLKRKAGANGEDVEMADETARAKKRAVENVNAVEFAAPPSQTASKPPSKTTAQKPLAKGTKKAGAAPGKPDQDEAFLKAVASTKRGKKHEDTFDRDFNNLRISKPDLRSDDAHRQWGVLEEFGDDGDIRGNFMVVVEMDVFRKESREDRSVLRADGRLDWAGRPDFKKFKKKAIGERRRPVELYVEDDTEYDINSQLWNGNSQPQSRSQVEALTRPSQSQTEVPTSEPTQTQKKSRTRAPVVDSDDEMLPPPTQARAKGRATQNTTQSRSQVPPPTQKRATRATRQPQAGQKSQPLFVESDEEGGDIAEEQPSDGEEDEAFNPMSQGDEDEEFTLRSTGRRTQESRSRKPKPTGSKRAAAIVVDDSDDGMTFKGFGAKRTRR